MFRGRDASKPCGWLPGTVVACVTVSHCCIGRCRFRPNFVVSGLSPFEEDGWAAVEIGGGASFSQGERSVWPLAGAGLGNLLLARPCPQSAPLLCDVLGTCPRCEMLQASWCQWCGAGVLQHARGGVSMEWQATQVRMNCFAVLLQRHARMGIQRCWFSCLPPLSPPLAAGSCYREQSSCSRKSTTPPSEAWQKSPRIVCCNSICLITHASRQVDQASGTRGRPDVLLALAQVSY
jgi:hypothetical protein